MKMLFLFFVGAFWFGFYFPVQASSVSPPTVDFSDALTPTSTVYGTATVYRDYGEIGDSVYRIEYEGDCVECISGPDSVVLLAKESYVSIPFSLTPGDLSTGSYKEYVTFILSQSSSDPGVLGVSVVQAVAVTVRFSIINSSATSSSVGSKTTTNNKISSPVETPSLVKTPAIVETPSTVDTPTAEETLSSTETPTKVEMPTTEKTPTSVETPTTVETPSIPSVLDSVPVVSPYIPFSYDYSQDDSVDSSEVSMFVSDYFLSRQENSTDIDVNNDSVMSLKDVVAFAKYSEMNTLKTVEPSLLMNEIIEPSLSVSEPVGPPLLTNDVIFYAKKVSEKGQYQFILTSAPAENLEDSLVFSLFVDTGSSGILASDMTLAFDPTVLRFIGSDTKKSVFPIAQNLVVDAENGSIRFLFASGTPFIGTNGYIATVYFQPLKLGNAGLAFEHLDTYLGENVTESVMKKDIIGTLVKPQEDSIIAPSSSLQTIKYPCGCFIKSRFPLCVTLLSVMFSLLLTLLCFWKIHCNSKKIIL